MAEVNVLKVQTSDDKTYTIAKEAAKYSELLHNAPESTDEDDDIPLFDVNSRVFETVKEYLEHFSVSDRDPTDMTPFLDTGIKNRGQFEDTITEFERQYIESLLKQGGEHYCETIMASNSMGVTPLMHLLLADFALRVRNRVPEHIADELGLDINQWDEATLEFWKRGMWDDTEPDIDTTV